MLGEGLFQSSVTEQRVVARQLDDLAQIGDRLAQPAVVDDQLHFLVEGLVGLEIAVDVVGGSRPFELVVDESQAGQVAIGGLAGRVGGALAFEQGHDGENFVQVALGNLRYVAAAPRLEGDQAFGGEHLERLPQGGAGDAVVSRQGLLVNPGSGLQFMGKDALTQAFRDFLVKGDRGDAADGHGRI